MKIIREPIFNTEVFLTTGNIKDNPLGAFVEAQDHLVKGVTIRRYRIHVCDPKDFYSLLHEMIHLVKGIMEDRGIPFREENDEIIAYLTEHWFKILWRELNRKKGGKNGKTL